MCELSKGTEYRYNVRNYRTFRISSVKTVHYGTDTMSFIRPKRCLLLPSEIKSSKH